MTACVSSSICAGAATLPSAGRAGTCVREASLSEWMASGIGFVLSVALASAVSAAAGAGALAAASSAANVRTFLQDSGNLGDFVDSIPSSMVPVGAAVLQVRVAGEGIMLAECTARAWIRRSAKRTAPIQKTSQNFGELYPKDLNFWQGGVGLLFLRQGELERCAAVKMLRTSKAMVLPTNTWPSVAATYRLAQLVDYPVDDCADATCCSWVAITVDTM